MQSRSDANSSRPVVEFLERRSLLSGLSPLIRPALSSAMIGQVHRTIATDPAGIAAIMSALDGGMGKEWISLIRAGVKNPLAVIAGFETGKYTSYSISGLTAESPSIQPAFTGQPYDQLLATVAGASVFKRNTLELGAIMARAVPRPGSVVLRLRLQPRRWSQSGSHLRQPPGNYPRRTRDNHRRSLRYHGYGNRYRPDDSLDPGDFPVQH